MVFSTSKTPFTYGYLRAIPHAVPLIAVMPRNAKRLSAEEALSLILDATDQDSDSELSELSDADVDILTVDPPAPVATKVSEPEYCIYVSSNSDSDLLELKPANTGQGPSLSSSNTSPSTSPPSSPVKTKKKYTRKHPAYESKPRDPKRHIPLSYQTHISTGENERPTECPSSSPEPPSSSPEPRSRSPDPISSSPDPISSSSEPFPSSGSSSDESRFLPPEHFPDPPKFENTQRDLDEMNDSIEDFDLGEALSQTITRPNFLISKIPFRIMCMYIKRYLISIQIDPTKPEWPVPGMDKNQKCHFRRKVERYTVKRRILYYLHKFSDKTIGYEWGKLKLYT